MAFRKTPVRKARPKPAERWGQEKEVVFLAALVKTCNVSASARAAKVSEAHVYRQRAKSPEFRAAWGVALREGYARLELMMLERAISGQVKPVFFGGKQIGEITEYSDRTALALLAAHRGAATGEAVVEDDSAVKARLEAKFEEMGRRLRGEG
ncbi:hypothetical protein PQ455_00090 [Sphingomonas naphthae]|uniref:Terminase n=1 Tax=Sphingomonas naphthae TaxID=1813468 RepID=A0ABY7TKB2_9SPHN|nr:hypothetical protein [Sphingomonas naphthae]WCT73667.1 hypothetical protein PQ455_00090 [Sphingomonas naphthae]